MNKVTICITVLTVGMALSIGPPIQPPAYSVFFTEVLHIFGQTFDNNGYWFYDFLNGRMRYDHLRGHRDNFCYGQNLSDSDPHGPCTLLFTNHSYMYVYYPLAKNCCALCGEKDKCTVLKPTWLSNGTFTGKKTIQGSTCYGWITNGFDFRDELYVTDKNIPCQYTENSYDGDISHTITFNQSTYKVGQPNPELFEIPYYCNKKCPRPPFPPNWYPTQDLHV